MGVAAINGGVEDERGGRRDGVAGADVVVYL
jgi:hypothetical protein